MKTKRMAAWTDKRAINRCWTETEKYTLIRELSYKKQRDIFNHQSSACACY